MDQVSEIRERIDLVAYLSEFLTLKKAGRNFTALCPFHTEKSPSFMVSPERQMWHCFGCGKGGDIYSFLMDYEHIEFPEALKLLAKRAGVQLIQSKFETETSSKKDKLYMLNALAAEFYHYILTKHPAGKKALAYIQNRGVSDKTLETFKIGFAPASGNALMKYLVQKKKYDPQLLYEAGLIGRRGNDSFDFFRGRIMFPLIDHRDNVVGFSGRVLDQTQQAKYVNTKETLVYHKGEMFFGFYLAKDVIRSENQAIVMEGEFDVISSFQEGIGNAIAVKGTALTPNQATLLKRYTTKVTMCFDGDKAGQEAIKRSVSVLEEKGLITTVVQIPGNLDPDEAIKKDPYVFKKALKGDVSAYDFLLTLATSQYDIKTAEGKKQVANDLLPFFTSITNEIIKEHYLKKLSQVLDTSFESILRQIDKQKQKVSQNPVAEEPLQKKPREEVLEAYLVSLILQHEKPEAVFPQVMKTLREVLANDRAHQKLLWQLDTYFETEKVFSSGTLATFLPDELLLTLNTALLFPLPSFIDGDTQAKEIHGVVQELRAVYLREKITQLSSQIAEKEQAEDTESLSALHHELSRFILLVKENKK